MQIQVICWLPRQWGYHHLGSEEGWLSALYEDSTNEDDEYNMLGKQLSYTIIDNYQR